MNREREAAHILLDAVTAFDHEQGETPENLRAVKLAFARLQEVDAVSVTEDDDGTVVIDIAPVLVAAGSLLTLLIRRLAEDRGADYDATVAAVREIVDESIFPEP